MKLCLNNVCPNCGQRVHVTNKGYFCSHCGFRVPGYVCNRHISIGEAENILSDKRQILDGFSTNDGKMFSSIPVVAGDTVKCDNTVFSCNQLPAGIGRIIVGRRFFKCERKFECHEDCLFAKGRLRRCIDGHMVTASDIARLMRDGEMAVEGFGEDGEVRESRIRLAVLIH